ncbi:MAG: taurine catabolism dioxygenase TauD, partial [Rhodospirillales bacterium]|nr:taurine catabolism dioxygenase TauD [Rhodospirillales bacterium]
EALDMYVNLCAELQHFQEFAPGDIQFLNNHVIMHSRTEYWDWPNAPERKRHLLRLWLRAPDIRPVLEVFDERLNGISVPGLVPTVPLDVE